MPSWSLLATGLCLTVMTLAVSADSSEGIPWPSGAVDADSSEGIPWPSGAVDADNQSGERPPMSVATRDRNSQKIITMEIPGTPNGLRGPVGPPGPPGPAGPAGAQVTKDVLLQEFRNMVRDAAERRAQALIDDLCEDCEPSILHNITGPYLPPLFEVDEAAVVPKIIWGFNCNLEEETKVARRTLVELNGFYVPFAQGGFQRGEGIDPPEGRFAVSRSGVYNFVTNLQIRHRTMRSKPSVEGKKSGKTLRIMICINSLCQRNVSLETTVQLIPIPWQGTVTVSGFLQMQKDQYVSIYVDNLSNEAILVLGTSNFSGTLIGL